ncbi:MAG: IS607 family transposase [Caldilineaceae bacterium]
MNTYNISEFSKIVGVAVKTLQRWDREGKLSPTRTPGNRRVYTDAHIAQATGLVRKTLERKTVVYMRVSSAAQKPDLETQYANLQQFCTASGIAVNEWVKEIGGGLNFGRPKFLQVVDSLIAGQIECLVIAHKDRLVRFGYELLEHLCKRHGCKLVVMNVESLSPEQEMIQDMLAIVHCFSSRLYGAQGVPVNYRKALRKALENDTGAQNQTES